jgi:hypothetical protein
MAAKNYKYAYSVDIIYVNGKKQTEIDSKSISMIAIDYDYETKNAPIIFMKMNLEVATYNSMVKNSKSAKLYLNIKVYDADQSNPIKRNYIKEQFSYFFASDNIEYDQDLVEDTKSSKTAYRTVAIGLIKSELVDDNKKTMNNIFKNTNTSTILHYYTHHMNMIIEPFDNNPTHGLFVVPPIEGISKLIKFLNESSSFYNTSYRYFMDFSKTYLLSTKGKAISTKDNTYDTIKIDVINDTTNKTTNKGLKKDTDNKLYTIEISAADFSVKFNKITEKKFNKLTGVDSMGNKISSALNINNEEDSSTKTRMVRLYNGNSNYIGSLADEIETTSAVITVVKGYIDCSLIVPYKEYRIANIKEYSKLDGKYLLASKKEVFQQSDTDFACSTSMTFKKVS